jgi:hypothetical protein
MHVGDAQLIHFGQRAIVLASQAAAYAALAAVELDEQFRRKRIKQAEECIDASNAQLRFASEVLEVYE